MAPNLSTTPSRLSRQGPGVFVIVLHLTLSVFAQIEDHFAQFKLKVNNIVPHIIPMMPDHSLSIVYKTATVMYGNLITGYDMMEEPVNISWAAKQDFHYSLFMLGPDSPIREQPMDKNWLHWLVTNIPGSDVSKGQVIAQYCGSLAGYEIGLHRLIYVVYEQPGGGKLKFNEEYLDEDADYAKRCSFNLVNFTSKYYIEKAVAANFAVLDLSFRLPGQ